MHSVIANSWEQIQLESEHRWPLRDLPPTFELKPVAKDVADFAQVLGTSVAGLDVMEASYVIGVVYISLMPPEFRTDLGAYHTPPGLCDRLLDMATEAGVDWSTATVLDPACGGGAFLSPVARRMAQSLKELGPEVALSHIETHLRGFELDPFAAWMSQVFLDVTLLDLCHAAGRQMQSAVQVCDSLEQEPDGRESDLIVGNPPYGRVTLSPGVREKYRRSLFGHANLYGLFTDLALRFAKTGGVIAYVTPTSFLGGEYFKALRGLLGREAPPVSIDFIENRKGVFADVLQETLLAVYRRGGALGEGKVQFISSTANGSVKTAAAGYFGLPASPDQPWLMPRNSSQSALVRAADALPYRLADYGYTVSTGPLVWNRHKSRLRAGPGKGRYPLVWAESVRSDNVFEFRAQRRNHKPYFEPTGDELWVVTDFPCVLLQRTTAKEQYRRLIAAELPEWFIEEHGAVVVENHLNMVRPINGAPMVSTAVVATLLQSAVVDQMFRCINGSVAVSAYELESLPLPSPDALQEIEQLVRQHASQETIERAVERLYGIGAG
jgi:adenine-specific DNA-methyltransferase